MLCGSGGAPGVRPGRAKRQAARCQRTVLVAHTIVAGVRLTASVPLLESARRIRVASADAQGYLRRVSVGLNQGRVLRGSRWRIPGRGRSRSGTHGRETGGEFALDSLLVSAERFVGARRHVSRPHWLTAGGYGPRGVLLAVTSIATAGCPSWRSAGCHNEGNGHDRGRTGQ
jgi:hypothetical protein